MEFLAGPSAGLTSSARGRTSGETASVGDGRCLAFLWRCWLVATLLLAGSTLSRGAWAAEFDEYAIKAAYLYNFAKFVEWPSGAFAGPGALLLICIAGDNPFGGALETLSGKSVNDHPVEVRHLPAGTGLEKCHIVFVGRAEQGRFKAVLAKLARLPILTVSDIGDFTQAGGMIGLVEADQRIRFNINLAATHRAGLNLSSQLLKLATIVDQGGGGN